MVNTVLSKVKLTRFENTQLATVPCWNIYKVDCIFQNKQ